MPQCREATGHPLYCPASRRPGSGVPDIRVSRPQGAYVLHAHSLRTDFRGRRSRPRRGPRSNGPAVASRPPRQSSVGQEGPATGVDRVSNPTRRLRRISDFMADGSWISAPPNLGFPGEAARGSLAFHSPAVGQGFQTASAGRVVPRDEGAGHVSRPRPSPWGLSPDLDTPPRSSSATRSAEGGSRWSRSAPRRRSRARVETSTTSLWTLTGSRHASSFLVGYSINGCAVPLVE